MRAQEGRSDKASDLRTTARQGASQPTTADQLLALQRLAGNAAVSRAVAEERHQHDADCGHAAAGTGTNTDTSVQRSAVHQALRAPGRPLDTPLRTEMEARLGADFSDVRIHSDAVARRSAAEIGARAYTSGNHVVVGEGGADKHTLAHELTHVIQQRQGPVAGTDDGGGLRVSDPGDRFEREAEANARRVMGAAVPVRGAVETGSGPGTGVPNVQRAPSGTEAAAAGARYRQSAPTGDEDRDVTLRMLDRLSRVALDTIKGRNPEFKNKKKQILRGKKKITPHLAVSLLPNGPLAIAGNTGEHHVTDTDKRVVEEELRKYLTGQPEMRHAKEKDRTKIKALTSGDYAQAHGNASGLLAIEAALRGEIVWYAVGATESVPASQHGEMTVLGKHVAHWLANPRKGQTSEKVMMGGVKKACRSCQWAFDAVNEHLGRPNGYEVEASGTHHGYYRGWMMPAWMRAHPLVVAAVERKANEIGVSMEGWVLGEAPTDQTGGGHDPDASASEWESDHE